MSELLRRLEHNIRQRGLFREGQPLLIAVSGGVDSMVLLRALHQLSTNRGWRLTVAHLNHRLRGRSSNADEALVRRTAQTLKVPVIVERTDVRQFARARKLSIEMAARELRHDFLARAAARFKIRSIALAHHADDQLELFFLRLLRGSGGDGLSGMKWRNPSPKNPAIHLVRPLLDQPKSSLLKYAAEKKIRFREDASNASLDIQRNRIRHELLPLLRRKYLPHLHKTILRVMDIVGAETELVSTAANSWLEKPAAKRLSFEKLPVAVQRRCLQFQLREHGIAPTYDLVEELRLASDQPVNIAAASPPGTRNGKAASVVRDSAGRLYLRQIEVSPRFQSGSRELDLGQAGETLFDGVRIRWRISSRQPSGARKNAPGREVFDADSVGSRVLLRHWQPGDRFQPIGRASSVKLQDFFTNEKVPRARRHQLIVAVSNNGEVFWVEGLRISERFKLAKATIRRLQWRWKRL